MPKKRKTRAAPSRKAAPKIGEPSVDEAKQDKDDRAEAIAVYKEEFEQELKSREKKLEKELKDLTKTLKASHRTTLISVPSFIQKMTVQEFVAMGGNVEAAAKAIVESSVSGTSMGAATTSSSTSVAGLTGEPLAEVTNRLMPAPAPMDGISLAMETPMETSRTRAKRKPNPMASTATATRASRRTTRQATVDIGDTPAPSAPTPAFDSRLPGLRQGAGRARGKTKREVTMTVNPDNRDDVLSMLSAVADCIPDSVEDDLMLQKCRDLQARLTIALGTR